MQYSTNNHLKLMEGTDNVRRQDFVDNFNSIDNGLSKFYVATQSSANVYKITTGLNKTSLANGYSVKVAIPSASNGAVSLIVDTCNAVEVKKPNGNAVTNFKQNGVYQLVYYNSVFILASGGIDDVNFSASDLLENKSANNSDGEKVNGTMKNVGQQTATINAGGRVNISKGYHDGTGYVQSNTMAKQLTDLGATLTSASQLVSGVKAVDKNGKLITGTATIKSLGGYVLRTFTGTATIEYIAGGTNKKHITVPAIGFTPKVMYLTGDLDSTSAFNPNSGRFDYPLVYAGESHILSCKASATDSFTINVGGTNTQTGGLGNVRSTVSYEFITWE